ncbi:MAG: hypothetical protein LBT00_14135 [Spirochaetaceae bacterium]|jgi:hypothetical protein|nr:hypothetical protein [Spirochaetaceae bacterium]
MFDKEEAFFEAHKEEMRVKYTGKRILIVGDEIKGVFDNDGEAYRTAIETMKPGAFMIKRVTRTDDEAVCRYRSRVLSIQRSGMNITGYPMNLSPI